MVLLLVAGQFCPAPKPDHALSDSLTVLRDSMHVSTERFQRLLADSSKLESATVQDSLEALAVRSADSLRSARLSLRGRREPLSPRTQPADTARLLAELDTVREERDLAVQESDSLRVALYHADSSKTYITKQLRAVQIGADEYLRSQTYAEGRLNWALPQVGKLEKDIAALRRGCRVPLLGLRCPVVGPGVVMGTDLQPRVGVAVIIPL